MEMVFQIKAARVALFTGALLVLLQLGGCQQEDCPAGTPNCQVDKDPMPFAVSGQYLAFRDGTSFRPIYVKGINLGVGVPGTQPGELAPTLGQYKKWFAMMGEAGFNAIRIYTLHFPRFYEALDAHNRAHPDRPLYVLQGIWLDEFAGDTDLYTRSDHFDEAIEETVNCSHGNCTIAHRYGRAYGTYSRDISKWILGWLIGREVSPYEVKATNDANPGKTVFEGHVLRLPSGNPMEAWAAARLDHLIAYERGTYDVERPVSFSSWPTLDPLNHPTENSESLEDTESLDLASLELFDAPAGYFISYHAYPYYPDFINEEPAYLLERDALGVNNYLGYLKALKAHYHHLPVLIAEYGVPSSWGNAHSSPSGMHHGGHDEVQAGRYGARMTENIRQAGMAGGAYFSWFDEWWKPSWITAELEFPWERRRLWHNITAPEQNYGLLAFDLAAPDFGNFPSVAANGRLRKIETAADAAYLHVKLTLDSALSIGERLTIGFDTYGDNLGESILPDGKRARLRSELALVIEAPDKAQLYVTEAYDLLGIWHDNSAASQKYHSTITDGAPWHKVRWRNNGLHGSDDGQYVYPETIVETGALRVRSPGLPVTSMDAVVLSGESVTLRIPWTLLQFTDPSTRSVMADQRETTGREQSISEGVALAVSIDGELTESPLVPWDTWEVAPHTVEREKPTLGILSAALKAIEDYPR